MPTRRKGEKTIEISFFKGEVVRIMEWTQETEDSGSGKVLYRKAGYPCSEQSLNEEVVSKK